MIIKDQNNITYYPSWDATTKSNVRPKGYIDMSSVSGYDFIGRKGWKAKAQVHLGTRFLSSMVSDVLIGGWDMEKKLAITIREEHGLNYDCRDFTFEHEFGHVLGLFDAYGYKEHFGSAGEWLLPEADIDGLHVTESSVMLCAYQESIRDRDQPFIRTSTDWEMVLWAWQENRLQNYIGHKSGQLQSQVYFHSNRRNPMG